MADRRPGQTRSREGAKVQGAGAARWTYRGFSGHAPATASLRGFVASCSPGLRGQERVARSPLDGAAPTRGRPDSWSGRSHRGSLFIGPSCTRSGRAAAGCTNSQAQVARRRLPRTCTTAPACPPTRRQLAHTRHDPRSTIHDPRSTIHDPRSTIHDPRSTIHDPRSTIHDPRSTPTRTRTPTVTTVTAAVRSTP